MEGINANTTKVRGVSVRSDFEKQATKQAIRQDTRRTVLCLIILTFVAVAVVTTITMLETFVVVEKPSPVTMGKVLREDLIFRVAGPVELTGGGKGLLIGSVLVEAKNPNPDRRDFVVNAQVIPFRKIPEGTEVVVHIVSDMGISPQSFFYYAVEKSGQ